MSEEADVDERSTRSAIEAEEEESAGDAGGGRRRDYAPSVAARVWASPAGRRDHHPARHDDLRFAMAMIVIAATGHNPFKAFKGIFDGTGLNWLFPWVQAPTATTPPSTFSRR